MTSTKRTNFYPINKNGSISWNVSLIEFEEIEKYSTNQIKVKFINEHLAGQSAPSIKEDVPEFFIIDRAYNRILNEDGEEIALTSMLKRYHGTRYEIDIFKFQVRLLNNQCVELEARVSNEIPTSSGTKIFLANGCEQLLGERLEADYILLQDGEIIVPKSSGGKVIGKFIPNA
ncbi:hypothetical protein [Acinetobacter lactucae]|uniref:hypothetical protein n=1 Tax=Acinetobacter lactucae TaxID=1785128 RepID=UPI0034D2D4EB